VVHYRYVDGKRVFTKHRLEKDRLGTMGTALGTEKQGLCSNGVLFFGGGSRWGARGPLNRKPST